MNNGQKVILQMECLIGLLLVTFFLFMCFLIHTVNKHDRSIRDLKTSVEVGFITIEDHFELGG